MKKAAKKKVVAEDSNGEEVSDGGAKAEDGPKLE